MGESGFEAGDCVHELDFHDREEGGAFGSV